MPLRGCYTGHFVNYKSQNQTSRYRKMTECKCLNVKIFCYFAKQMRFKMQLFCRFFGQK